MNTKCYENNNNFKKSLLKNKKISKNKRFPKTKKVKMILKEKSNLNIKIISKPKNINKPKLNTSIVALKSIESIYIRDIYYNLWNYESKQIKINQNSKNDKYITLNMKFILFSWLKKICGIFNIRERTLWLSFELIDICLDNINIYKENLQLLGTVSLFMCCKFEELKAPKIKYFKRLCCDSYTSEEILNLEKDILILINYKLNRVLKIDYLGFFKKYFIFNEKQNLFLDLVLEITYFNKQFYLENYYTLMLSSLLFVSYTYKIDHQVTRIDNFYYFEDLNYNISLIDVNRIINNLNKILVFWSSKLIGRINDCGILQIQENSNINY